MALLSESTFNPLTRYVNVRLMQGVPIVDADVNELDDIRKFELRAFLKWFVGDGVPDGNDGFGITGTGRDNDFTIRFGGSAAGGAPPPEQGLRNVGRIIVDGLDVMITADVLFTEQDLHEDKPGADALAARLGVNKIARMPTPTADTTLAAYLDVWETLVTADDDTALLHTGLGVETCARMRRDWAVRVRAGNTAPGTGEPEFVAGHSYTLLALIARRAGKKGVRSTDVTDRRHRRLQLPPATLVEDVMGTSAAAYRAGLRRPPISLREALNALLRGELPASAEKPVAPAAGQNVLDAIERAFLRDSAGGLVAVFSSDRTNGTDQVYATRMSLDAVTDGFPAPVQVTSGVAHTRPSAAELPDGTLFVAYQSQTGVNADIVARTGALSDLGTATDIQVAATPAVTEDSPFVVVAGSVVTVFFHRTLTGAAASDRWQYRRWNFDTKSWVDANPVELVGTDTTFRDFHAALDSSGKIWAVVKTTGGIMATQVDPGSGAPPTAPVKIADQPGGASEPPFVLCPRSGGAWVFWQSNGISARQFAGGAWGDAVPNIGGTTVNDRRACAVEDADGVIWLIFSRGTIGAGDLFVMRRDPLGQWGIPRQLVASSGDDTSPFAVAGADTTVWVFWASDRDGAVKIYNKRLVTAI